MTGLTKDIKDKLRRQVILAAQIKDAQKEERELRAEIVKSLFPTLQDGSQATCHGDLEIKASVTNRISMRPGVMDEITAEQKRYLLNNFVSEETVYKVDKRKYDAMPDDVKLSLGAYIDEKPGLATLKCIDHRG